MLERVGLPDVKGVQLRKFSKGMLQRVGIAQAILHDPKLVFLDEPMSGLDPMGRREVRDLIEQLKREGKTVFFSTHILSDAEALCDRVAIIHRGELRGVGAVAELTSSLHGKVELMWQGRGYRLPDGSGRRMPCDRGHGPGRAAGRAAGRSDGRLCDARALRLISMVPVRTSLEDYFVEKLKPAGRKMAGARV